MKNFHEYIRIEELGVEYTFKCIDDSRRRQMTQLSRDNYHFRLNAIVPEVSAIHTRRCTRSSYILYFHHSRRYDELKNRMLYCLVFFFCLPVCLVLQDFFRFPI